VGHLTKTDVRKHAEDLGLKVASKPDSHEICFVPDGQTADFVGRKLGSGVRDGAIVDTGGKVLGKHAGLHRFTVGQRKGLGLSTGVPLYVLRLNPSDATVVVGSRDELGSRELTASSVNWISGITPGGPQRVTARIRHHHQDAAATVTATAAGQAHIVFDDPQIAVSPGQAVVFYEGEDVLGGGWIDN